MQENIFRWFALVAFLLYWTTVAFTLTHWPRLRSNPLSDHIAAGKTQIGLFIVIAAIETTLYAFFFYNWFIPHFNLPDTFKPLVTLALLTHMATFIFPSTSGSIKRLHWLASYTTALLFIPAAVLMVLQSSIPMVGKLAVCTSLIVMISISVGLFVMPAIRKQKLIIHNAYIFSLQFAVVFISLLRV